MCNPACFIFTVWLTALLVYPGVPARSGDSYLKDNITVRQGDSAVLKCNVDNKVSRVAWLNRTTILFTGNEKWSLDPRVVLLNTAVTEYSIKIINVNLYDEGPYVCSILTNKKPESTKVHLIVQVPARIVNISADVSVNEGSNVSLMCLAIGRPEPSIFWKFRSSKGDGKESQKGLGLPSELMSDRQIGNRIITEGEYVEMTGITKDMSGSYDCITSNDISPPDVRTVQVTVNYPPVISRARSTGTAVGQKGVLWCEASAVPLADFQWYKGERRLFNGLNRVKIENKGKQSMLTFFNVSEEDYGNYTCVAMNTLGITNASIILYGPGAIHDMNNAALSPTSSFLLLTLVLTLSFISKF
ncbi:opioid-binding protein/cell adhesion molecule homolog isoform X2 [Carassius gibelio]|uniref:opioid-binding protein/cell adhesion molecule homolog isoform X2 n=1 Tax=Carassius gibelio TaxID=101364 RepID=UPI00227923D3|nr:opioid-binding protein/cell adhesion molecule homolog isoform X2 [Carassius gibelio]